MKPCLRHICPGGTPHRAAGLPNSVHGAVPAGHRPASGKLHLAELADNDPKPVLRVGAGECLVSTKAAARKR